MENTHSDFGFGMILFWNMINEDITIAGINITIRYLSIE